MCYVALLRTHASVLVCVQVKRAAPAFCSAVDTTTGCDVQPDEVHYIPASPTPTNPADMEDLYTCDGRYVHL